MIDDFSYTFILIGVATSIKDGFILTSNEDHIVQARCSCGHPSRVQTTTTATTTTTTWNHNLYKLAKHIVYLWKLTENHVVQARCSCGHPSQVLDMISFGSAPMCRRRAARLRN